MRPKINKLTSVVLDAITIYRCYTGVKALFIAHLLWLSQVIIYTCLAEIFELVEVRTGSAQALEWGRRDAALNKVLTGFEMVGRWGRT